MPNIDPVSGNEVPAGAMPKEVRDDVDAKLSEGEYVIPANVVRYFGVKFFENLLEKANKSLGEMERGGRIKGDGDELPFSDEELEFEDDGEEEGPLRMAEGGFVPQSFDTSVLPNYTPQAMSGALPNYTPQAMSGVPVVETKTFKGPEGETTTVLFINGKPATAVPEGYTEVSREEKSTPTERAFRIDVLDDGAADGSKRNYEENNKWARDTSEWSNEDLNQFSQGIDTHLKVSKGIQVGLRLTSPIGGLMGKAMDAGSKTRIEAALEEIDKRVADGSMTVEEASINRDSLQEALKKNFKEKASVFDRVFGDKEPTAADMQRVAPEGMTYNDDTGSYIREGSAAPTTSPRPMAKPTNLTSSSGSDSKTSSGNSKTDWSKPADDPANSGGGTKFAKGGLVQRRKKKKS